MGNSIGRSKKAKVMKINGESIKLRTPVKAIDVTKDHPGYVLLDSDAVKRFGIRANPVEPHEELKAKKIYFLVELPKFPEEKQPVTRRVRSGITMSAKDRLEHLMLSRRTVSDLSIVRPSFGEVSDGPGPIGGKVRVKMRLPKAQLQKLVEESTDEAEVAGKIIGLYMGNSGEAKVDDHRKPEPDRGGENLKPRKRRVSFVPDEGEISTLAVADN